MKRSLPFLFLERQRQMDAGIQCDVLVIGGGGAGLLAAETAASMGCSVVVLNKGWIGHTGSTVMAPGAFAAVDEAWCSPGDSRAIHLADTMRSGQQINHPGLAQKVVYSAADAAKLLESMGAFFDRDEQTGAIALLRPDEGHSCNRALSFQRRIGQELLFTLRSAADRSARIRLLDNVSVFHLLKADDGSVCGAVGLDNIHMKVVSFYCKAGILSCGGASGLFQNSDAPLDITGDGMVLALTAGASLVDMEFIQFHPAGLLAPASLRGLLGTHMSVVHLYNENGERFMASYDPQHMERATRDVLSRAMATEVLAGRGSALGGVYGSLRHNSTKDLERKIPEYYRLYQRIGFDPAKDLLHMAPSAHYTMGGIRVDTSWQTELPGLFAAGESCGGVHGANRLSQNALSEMLVSGRIAGQSAAQYVQRVSWKTADVSPQRHLEQECQGLLTSAQSGISPGRWRSALRSSMSESAGVIRCEEGLKQALSTLDELEGTPMRLASSSPYMNGELIEALENRRMLLLARCVVLSALARRETRGAHARSDYPEADSRFLCNHVVRFAEGGPIVRADKIEKMEG